MKKDKCTRIQNELAKLIETAEAGCPRPETIPKDKDKEERIIANLEKNQGSRVLAKIFFRISTRKTPFFGLLITVYSEENPYKTHI